MGLVEPINIFVNIFANVWFKHYIIPTWSLLTHSIPCKNVEKEVFMMNLYRNTCFQLYLIYQWGPRMTRPMNDLNSGKRVHHKFLMNDFSYVASLSTVMNQRPWTYLPLFYIPIFPIFFFWNLLYMVSKAIGIPSTSWGSLSYQA